MALMLAKFCSDLVPFEVADAADERFRSSEVRCERLQRTLEDQRKLAEDGKAFVAKLERRLLRQQGKMNVAVAKANDLERQLNTIIPVSTRHESAIERLQNEHNQALSRVDELQEDMQQLAETIEAKDRELTMGAASAKSLQAQVSQLQAERICDMTLQHQKTAEIDRLTRWSDDARKALQKTESQLETASTDWDLERTNLQQELDEMENSNTDFRSENTHLLSMLASLTSENAKITSVNQELTSVNEGLQNESDKFHDLSDEYKTLDSERQALTSKVRLLELTASGNEETANGFAIKNGSLNDQIKQLNSSLEAMQTAKDELRLQNAQLVGEKAGLEHFRTLLEMEKKQWSTKEASFEIEKKQWSVKESKLDARIERLQPYKVEAARLRTFETSSRELQLQVEQLRAFRQSSIEWESKAMRLATIEKSCDAQRSEVERLKPFETSAMEWKVEAERLKPFESSCVELTLENERLLSFETSSATWKAEADRLKPFEVSVEQWKAEAERLKPFEPSCIELQLENERLLPFEASSATWKAEADRLKHFEALCEEWKAEAERLLPFEPSCADWRAEAERLKPFEYSHEELKLEAERLKPFEASFVKWKAEAERLKPFEASLAAWKEESERRQQLETSSAMWMGEAQRLKPFEQKYSDVESELTELRGLKSQVSGAQADARHWKSRFETAVGEHEAERTRIEKDSENWKSMYESHEGNIARIYQKFSIDRTKNPDLLSALLGDYNASIRKAQGMIDNLHKEKVALETRLDHRPTRETHHDLVGKYNQACDALEKSKAEINTLGARPTAEAYAKLESQLSQLRTRPTQEAYNDQAKKHTSLAVTWSAEKTKLEKQAAGSNAQYEQVKKERDTLRTTTEAIQTQLQELQVSCDELSLRVEVSVHNDLKQELAKSRQEKAAADVELEKLKKELEEVKLVSRSDPSIISCAPSSSDIPVRSTEASLFPGNMWRRGSTESLRSTHSAVSPGPAPAPRRRAPMSPTVGYSPPTQTGFSPRPQAGFSPQAQTGFSPSTQADFSPPYFGAWHSPYSMSPSMHSQPQSNYQTHIGLLPGMIGYEGAPPPQLPSPSTGMRSEQRQSQPPADPASIPFLVSGRINNGQKTPVPMLSQMLSQQINDWNSDGKAQWAKVTSVSHERCIDTRRQIVSRGANPPANDPSGDVACARCIRMGKLCVLIGNESGPVVVPLPPSVRGAGAIPTSEGYYVVT